MMKLSKLQFLAVLMATVLPFQLIAQDRQMLINGTVTDMDGKPVQNAVISANSGSAKTGKAGNYQLSVARKAPLRVVAEGYMPNIFLADSGRQDVVLVTDSSAKKANLLFRSLPQKDLLGAVSVVDYVALMKKSYAGSALENLGSLIGGFNGNVWGMGEYLVLIDGVPRDAYSDIHPSEIDQITVLKGVANLAIYGSRAAKGVIQITTKRGRADQRQISVRVNSGIHIPKRYPNYLGSAEYMTLYNEARRNDGLDELYSQESIFNHGSGGNPYRFPNIDFYSTEFLKKAYNRSDAVTEISGGTRRASFYTNIGYMHSGSLFKFGQAEKDQNSRMNVRGNLDIKLNDAITTTVDASAIFHNNRFAHGNYWANAATIRPNRFSPLIPIELIEQSDEQSMTQVHNSNHLIDGKYLLGGTQQDLVNPFADAYAAGYNKGTSRQFQFTNTINVDLKGVLPGLSFATRFGLDYSTSYTQSFNNQYAVYAPVWNSYSGTDLISSLQKFGEDRKNGTQNVSGSWRQQTVAFSGQFNYKRSFSDAHNVSAILVASGHQRGETSEYHKVQSHVSAAFQLGYNYGHKYFLEMSGTVLHSAKLPPGNRQAFSPTISVGWRLSQEKFFNENGLISDLMLTASGGMLHSDLDIPDYYLYQGLYTHSNGTWYSWRDGTLTRTTDSRRGENNRLTFARRKEVNFGIDASLLHGLLNMQARYFINSMEGLVTQASTLYPNYFVTYYPQSSFIPYVNYNIDKRVGVDLSVNVHKQAGPLSLDLGLNGIYYDSKAVRRDENFQDSYQERAGKPLDALFGLQNAGFYKDQDDILASPSQSFGQVKPGDIKYIDQNGDGVIDTRDEVFLGRAGWSGTPWTVGANFTAKLKGVTLFATIIGSAGARSMRNNSFFWINADDKYSEVVRGRWNEQNKDNATYPRLTSLSNDNNFRTSDFWMYNSRRLNLTRVQLTYDFPLQILKRGLVKGAEIYVAGSDLLTVSKSRKILETNVGSAPQTRFFNLGVKASF